MIKTYFLQVKDIIQETPDVITLSFWHPIYEEIKYKAGQFVTLKIPVKEGKVVKRSYSMSSAPEFDTSLFITVKRIEDGIVSNYLLDKIKKGDFLEVIEPQGNFLFEPDPNLTRHVVLIGAGSGITPLFSILKTILYNEPKSRTTLIYGSRSEKLMIFRKQLLHLENQFRERFDLRIVLSQPSDHWVGYKGRINKANILTMLKEMGVNFKNEEIYLCGPEAMMNQVIEAIKIFDFPESQTHREVFFVNNEVPESEIAEPNRTIKIIYEGQTHELEVSPRQFILEAALEKDIDLPYSCQAGMCTACLGLCKQGSVHMVEEGGLTSQEIDKGYVLTCVAKPTSDDVIIQID